MKREYCLLSGAVAGYAASDFGRLPRVYGDWLSLSTANFLCWSICISNLSPATIVTRHFLKQSKRHIYAISN